MTLKQLEAWMAMSASLRCEYNRPAYEALGRGEVIEMMWEEFDPPQWRVVDYVDTARPCRVHREPIEYYIVLSPDGNATKVFLSQESANEMAAQLPQHRVAMFREVIE